MTFPRVRFTVRRLMVIVLITSVGVGWIVRRAHIQRDAVSAITRIGGHVFYHWETELRNMPDGRVSMLRMSNNRPRWLMTLLGYLETDLHSDPKVAFIWGGSHLQPRDADAVMAHVARLEGLEGLFFRKRCVPVTDAGLGHLSGMSSLRIVCIEHAPQVTDAGLKYLAGLRSLQVLRLYGTGVTSAGVAGLQRARRDIKIVTR